MVLCLYGVGSVICVNGCHFVGLWVVFAWCATTQFLFMVYMFV